MTEIIMETKTKRQKKILKYMINLAQELLKLRNFQSLYAVFGGLNNYNITKLQGACKLLSLKHKNINKELENITSALNNYSNYRQILKENNNCPTIPYIGVVMKDLLFWKENCTRTKSSEQINVDHLLQLGTLIDGIMKFKKK